MQDVEQCLNEMWVCPQCLNDARCGAVPCPQCLNELHFLQCARLQLLLRLGLRLELGLGLGLQLWLQNSAIYI